MAHHPDEFRRRLAAAMNYIKDPNSDPFTLEGLRHMEALLEDMMRRAKMASIMSGKALTQDSIGEDAAFDLYYRGQATLQLAIRAQSLSFLIRAMIEQDTNTISLEELLHLYSEVTLKVTEKHKDLNDFGSSITHLMEKSARKRGQP